MEKSKFKLYLSLLLTFMKIGVVTFGGGYAMIPIIETETSKKKKWISENDLIDIVAISESTPGPISICAATFIGYQVAGVLGAFFAIFGVILPSFVIIYILSIVLTKFESIEVIRYAFVGIRAGVLALLIKAVISMFKKAPHHLVAYIIMALSFGAVVLFGANVLVVILSSAIIGLVCSLTAEKRGKKL